MELSDIGTGDLSRLREALARGRLRMPFGQVDLQSVGLRELPDAVLELGPLGTPAALAVLDAVLAERRAQVDAPELVWTGPELRSSSARDTAVVLRGLFQSAQERILLAGFAFDHADRVLEPLHQAIQRGVRCRLFADVTVAQSFLRDHWPFGPPFPEVYAFTPAEGVYASLHAKCVVVDGRRVFITSANFTDRGMTRNLEVGVLMEAPELARTLEAQFASGSWFSHVG